MGSEMCIRDSSQSVVVVVVVVYRFINITHCSIRYVIWSSCKNVQSARRRALLLLLLLGQSIPTAIVKYAVTAHARHVLPLPLLSFVCAAVAAFVLTQ